MKKSLMLGVIILSLVVSMAMVSAQEVESYTTAIVGKVYNSDYTLKINDATVTVTCLHDNGNANITNTTTSFGDGDYRIDFSSDQCALGDAISVYGFKAGVGEGTGDGTQVNIDMTQLDVAIGVSNIALIPEFGFFVGALTLFSAVGIFFLVRRK